MRAQFFAPRVARKAALVGLLLTAAAGWSQWTAVLLDPGGDSFARAVGPLGIVGGTGNQGGNPQAAYWSFEGAYTSLHPPGESRSLALAVNERAIGGHVGINGNSTRWDGSTLDRGPLLTHQFHQLSGWSTGYGYLYGGGGGQFVGAFPGYNSAVLWRADYGSNFAWGPGFVVLGHPGGYEYSRAVGSDGRTQVGTVFKYITPALGRYVACVWSGSSESFVDINPIDDYGPYWAPGSDALAVHGDQIGGSAWVPIAANNAEERAALWQRSGPSFSRDDFRDLHPGGHFGWSPGIGHSSRILSVHDGEQAGWVYHNWDGVNPSRAFAAVWDDTPESVQDLGALLPAAYLHSRAFGIWHGNGKTYVVGEALNEVTQRFEAVLWVREGAPVFPVAGTVVLQHFSGQTNGMPIYCQIRTPGTMAVLESHTVRLRPDGGFVVPSSRTGTYDVAIKASHWLRARVGFVTIGQEGATGVNASLTNGDANGDDSVNLADFLALRYAYGSMPGEPRWNPNADLNGDRSVSVADFLVLRSGFGRSGE